MSKNKPHIFMKPSRTTMKLNMKLNQRLEDKLEDCIVICKKGKKRGYGKRGDRMIWTKGKTYKCKMLTIGFRDRPDVHRYWITTNRDDMNEVELLDGVEFKQRFKIFTKV